MPFMYISVIHVDYVRSQNCRNAIYYVAFIFLFSAGIIILLIDLYSGSGMKVAVVIDLNKSLPIEDYCNTVPSVFYVL